MPNSSVVVVMDNGSATTKLGYAGNESPTFVLPTVIAEPNTNMNSNISSNYYSSSWGDSMRAGSEVAFLAGDEAAAAHSRSGTGKATGWRVSHPVRHGRVEDWDCMEKLWQHCFYRCLRVEPREAGVVLAEPSVSSPESREASAEVLFETLGVRQLYIVSQATLALRAIGGGEGTQARDTGIVVESGEADTYVVPIVDGYVISHAIQHMPLGGRDITEYVLQRLRERREPLEGSGVALAEQVKERYGYVSLSHEKEVELYDGSRLRPPPRTGTTATNVATRLAIAHERFMGPELYFQPHLSSPSKLGAAALPSLPELIDAAVWASPMDSRRPLYRHIVLAGGSTLFPGMGQRLEAELHGLVGQRARQLPHATAKYEVNVVAHLQHQRHAAWCGGSLLGASPTFNDVAKTREQYLEEGPGIMRDNGLLPLLS